MKWIVLFFTLFLTITVNAQDAIIKTFVETYYISDNNDATDTLGGFLQSGSTTYRIYLQLKKACKLLSVYGDANHTIKINSTDVFFNNKDRGKTFGKEIVKTNLSNNTVALDSWITIGQATTTKNGLTYFGIPKSLDKNVVKSGLLQALYEIFTRLKSDYESNSERKEAARADIERQLKEKQQQ